MSPFSALVLFIVIWWTILFVTLPFGVRGQLEDDNVVPGSEPGAPVTSHMGRKALITTAITAIIWALVCCAIIFGWVSMSNLPFIPKV